MFFYPFCTRVLAENNNNGLNTASSQIFDASFDYSRWAKRKQRLECAHALGTARGEDDGGNITGLWTWSWSVTECNSNLMTKTEDPRPKAKDQYFNFRLLPAPGVLAAYI